MAFTDAEKVKIRHHMGYLNVGEVQTFSLGVPAALETQYLIEGAMNRVLEYAEVQVKNIVAKMDIIEEQMTADLELLAVTKVAEIEIDPKEMPKLRREYRYWQRTLGNLLGIPPNPYDQRFANSMSVPVQH
jgi:hypothetical protein